jgi:DNA-directed RNA polymerase specialized sigma24 family protein
VPFQELLRRARAGDQASAAALTRQVEPELKKVVRQRLRGLRLARVLDPTDICQSVLTALFSGLAAGRFVLDEPRHLLRLVVRMAQNRVRDEARRHRADRRDSRRTEDAPGGNRVHSLLDARPTPSKIVGGKELVEEIYRRLSPAERYLTEQRVLGRSWAALGAELNESPEALRKRLARAVQEITRQLGLGGPPPPPTPPTPPPPGSRRGRRSGSGGDPGRA